MNNKRQLKDREPSSRLTDFEVEQKNGTIRRMPQNPEIVTSDDPRWQNAAVDAGWNLKVDLGLVKIHIVHYVWQLWYRHRMEIIILSTRQLSENIAKKWARQELSLRGTSQRSVRKAVAELIEDGILLKTGEDRLGRPIVAPAWSLAFTTDPVECWRFALSSLHERLGARRTDMTDLYVQTELDDDVFPEEN